MNQMSAELIAITIQGLMLGVSIVAAIVGLARIGESLRHISDSVGDLRRELAILHAENRRP